MRGSMCEAVWVGGRVGGLCGWGVTYVCKWCHVMHGVRLSPFPLALLHNYPQVLDK